MTVDTHFDGVGEVVRRAMQRVELLDPPEDAPGLRAQVAAYEDWLVGQDFSAATVECRVALARRLLFEWGSWDQPPSTIATWLGQYDQWTRRTSQNHLTSLFAFLLETGVVEADPMARMRRKPPPPPRPKPLSTDELERVLRTASGDVLAALVLASKAGLRAHEIAKFRGEDVDDFGLSVRGKGGKVARLPVHPMIRELADDYPRPGYWFPAAPTGRRGVVSHVTASTISQRVGKHFRAQGIVEGGIHRCRHTYGTQLVRAGTPIYVVRDLMRHSSLETTQLYLGVNEEERLAAITRI